jgi:hypothetical protein
MNSQQVDVKVKVSSVMVQYKKSPSEVSFRYPTPQPPVEINRREIDPNYVSVQLLFDDKEDRQFVLNMVLSTEYAKKLSLMAGDKLTLKLTKESQ